MTQPIDPTEERTFTIRLTIHELITLQYVVPSDGWGDPLKDIYEMYQGRKDGVEEPDDPYANLKSLNGKMAAMRWENGTP